MASKVKNQIILSDSDDEIPVSPKKTHKKVQKQDDSDDEIPVPPKKTHKKVQKQDDSDEGQKGKQTIKIDGQKKGKKEMNNKQYVYKALTFDEFDWKRVSFKESTEAKTKDGKGSYFRAKILYEHPLKNGDTAFGPLIMAFEKTICYGVSPIVWNEDNSTENNDIKGYQAGIVLMKEFSSPTEYECKVQNFLCKFRQRVKDYAIKNKKQFWTAKADLQDVVIESKVSHIMWPQWYAEKEKPTKDTKGTPTLYTKIRCFDGKAITRFYESGSEGKAVNPIDCKTRFFIAPTVQFDNIFINKKTISLQHFIFDATIKEAPIPSNQRLAVTSMDEDNELMKSEESDSENFSADEDD